MSILNHIEKLQGKPEQERRVILNIMTACLMLVIFLIWVFSVNVFEDDSKIKVNSDVETEGEVIEGYLTPLESMKRSIFNFIDDIKKGVDVVGSSVKGEVVFEENDWTADGETLPDLNDLLDNNDSINGLATTTGVKMEIDDGLENSTNNEE